MYAKQPFSKKKEYRNALDKEIQIVTELVVVGDLCAFVASVGRFKIGRVMQFLKYDKNNKELQYKGNYADIVGKFGVLCTWYKASDDQFVYTMSNTSSLDYQPLNSYICTLTPNCIFQNPPDSAIKSYNPCFKPSIISAEKQFILTEEALQHISTLLKEKAKPLPVVIQDSNDPSEKKQT